MKKNPDPKKVSEANTDQGVEFQRNYYKLYPDPRSLSTYSTPNLNPKPDNPNNYSGWHTAGGQAWLSSLKTEQFFGSLTPIQSDSCGKSEHFITLSPICQDIALRLYPETGFSGKSSDFSLLSTISTRTSVSGVTLRMRFSASFLNSSSFSMI